MRVNENSLTDQVSSTTSRAAESQRIQVDTATSSNSPSAAAGDRVDLSGLAGKISQSLQTLATQTAQRVGQLQQAVQAGRYQPDTRQIAGAIAGS